jgi:hypothetical protein
MFQPVPNVAELRIKYTDDTTSREYENVFHCFRDGGVRDSDIDTLVSRMQSYFDDDLAGYMSNGAQAVLFSARNIAEEFGYSNSDDTAVAGGGAGPWADYQCSIFVQFRGASGFAPRHGGIFWPWVQEDDVDRGGTLSGSALTRDAAWSDYLDDVCGGGIGTIPCIVSRFNKSLYPDPPHLRPEGVYNTIASLRVRAVVASQKNRRNRPA